MRKLIVLLLLVALAACSPDKMPSAESHTETSEAEKRFEYRSPGEIADLFDSLNYTPASWAEGNREVPRIFLTTIPDRWRSKTSKEITVLDKKRAFFRLLAPLVLRANELVMEERNWLEERRAKIESGNLDPEERTRALAIAVRYGELKEGQDLEGLNMDALLQRVDVIPLSLALAQAAEESGWGTSRFAAEGNALFGQWTFDGSGIAPEQKREGLGNYGIKAFDAPLESVRAYLLNINSHRSYAKLREARAAKRATGGELSGYELAGSLTSYSERGAEYVETLRSIMTKNRLREADQAYLAKGPAMLLVPVGDD